MLNIITTTNTVRFEDGVSEENVVYKKGDLTVGIRDTYLSFYVSDDAGNPQKIYTAVFPFQVDGTEIADKSAVTAIVDKFFKSEVDVEIAGNTDDIETKLDDVIAAIQKLETTMSTKFDAVMVEINDAIAAIAKVETAVELSNTAITTAVGAVNNSISTVNTTITDTQSAALSVLQQIRDK